MNRPLAAMLAAAVLAAAAIGPATAAPVTLKFGTTGPPFGPLYVEAYTVWAKEVTAASRGTVDVKVFPGSALGTMVNIYDRIINGVADVGYAVLGPIVTQFPKASVVGLPFEARNPREAGLGLLRSWQKGAFGGEFSKVHPVAMAAFTNVSIHSAKPFAKLEDFQGMKIGTQSRLMGQVIERLGGTPIAMPVSQAYEAINRGTIGGFATGWPAINPFKLAEVTKYHADVPLGAEMAFVSMNKQSYAKLPQAGKDAVDKYSGLHFTELMYKAIAKMADQGRATIKAKHETLVDLSEAEEARWRAAVEPITQAWVKATPDGAQVLADFRAEVEKVRKGM